MKVLFLLRFLLFMSMCKIFENNALERLDVMQHNFFSFQRKMYFYNTYVLSIKNLKNAKFMLTLQYIVWKFPLVKPQGF